MRLKLQLTANTIPIPLNYQSYLVQTLHKWLGRNDYHDSLSLYCFSWLSHLEMQGDSFSTQGGTWEIASPLEGVLERLIDGINADKNLFCGIRVKRAKIVEDKRFVDGKTVHVVKTPVFIKDKLPSGKQNYLFHYHKYADVVLTRIAKAKLKVLGCNESIQVGFDRTYKAAKTKLVHHKGIGLKGSICPIVIEGSAHAKKLLSAVGIGSSTGLGFGYIK